ncbi:hypothetical protein [Streptomyces lincolnensis]|uniref:hypothetical protein n=1 Tax=Streptomyces lincolnensis TaxID=1915 RepID=UPI0037D8679A
MGVDVLLMRVTQPGTSPRRRRLTEIDAYADLTDAFARLCSGTGLPLLSRIDPYGSLALTPADMDQLLDELAVLRGRTPDETDRTLLEEIARLARGCAADPSTELCFEGD